ncbi:histidinol dehydrogenase [Sporosarcina sp. Sa2YVA2]|uniref:Histidinol dehydrogenase n=1 Tax=Sporosarcina quadrami TaxID=2762234 RepID=A0ABR8U8X5_9BACL|nr:histidinol dehydrogenase [Sporosarcina quadrami]MBD7984483.1 histidinol dehydrogenase [Sporosarcina quadrami]
MKIVQMDEFLNELQVRNSQQLDIELDRTVLSIIDDVRSIGDAALYSYTKRFDGVDLDSLIVSDDEFDEAYTIVSEAFCTSLAKAKERITSYHNEQKEQSWFVQRENGVLLGQQVTPIERVGIYVPGGKAAYPSTVLMNAIPAKIAGVGHIAMTTPPQADGKVNAHVLVAAREAGVDIVYKVGGAQAIAALAYGTESIRKVFKITGPGNSYVARAKKWVFGDVAIDMIAGPSEICVLADETANVVYVAADLLSQAEHDEQAAAICVATSDEFAQKLSVEVGKQLVALDRAEIAGKSIEAFGRIILAQTLEQAIDIVNELAPEHLQIMVQNPMEKLPYIRNAGAIFIGDYSPEALGDYMAGPNHTLPTSGTAAFSSPLGVYDFMKKSSIIHYTKEEFETIADDIIVLAESERLTGHAQSIHVRKGNVE